jgi:hypothetical protein
VIRSGGGVGGGVGAGVGTFTVARCESETTLISGASVTGVRYVPTIGPKTAWSARDAPNPQMSSARIFRSGGRRTASGGGSGGKARVPGIALVPGMEPSALP